MGTLRSEKVVLEERAGIIAQVKDKWSEVSKRDNKTATEDELAFFDKANADVIKLTAERDSILAEKRSQASTDIEQRIGQYQALLDDKVSPDAETRGAGVLPAAKATDSEKRAYETALRHYLVYGLMEMPGEHRSVLQKGEKRGTATQISSTTTLGGYAMPEEWERELYKSMLYFSGALEACGIRYKHTSGGDYHIPTVNDTSNTGAIIAQGVGDTVKDVTFAEIIMKAWSYTSGIIKWSWESFDDLLINIDSETNDIASERMGRILNTHFTTGDNSSKPQGLVPGSTLGKAAAGATAIIREELVDLVHSVDRAYRMGPKVGFMMNDSTLSYIKKLAFGASDDRPLWQASIREGEPDRLEGFQYWVNNDMAAIATGAKTMLFGDFSKYRIRQVGNMLMARSAERYFEERAIAFSVFGRFDGRYVDTAAIKHLIQA